MPSPTAGGSARGAIPYLKDSSVETRISMRALSKQAVLDLILRLGAALAAEGIDYCHWKSNLFLGQASRGETDLDLLIGRESAQKFTQVLCGLGFREALAPDCENLPGVQHYYGNDRETGRLVHVHAHFQLIWEAIFRRTTGCP